MCPNIIIRVFTNDKKKKIQNVGSRRKSTCVNIINKTYYIKRHSQSTATSKLVY